MPSGICRSASSATSAGSSIARTPWSMRSAPSSSMASRTPSGPLDSPACTVRRKPGRACASERLCETRAGAAGSRLVAIDRERHHAWMSQRHQRVDQFGRGVRRLRAQQADAQAHRRKPVLFCGGQAGIDRVDHGGQTTVPRRPVRRVDDHVGVACAAVGQPLAVAVAQLGQAFAGRRQATSPVEEVQEVRQAFELEQALERPGHEHARLRCPLFENARLEAAFEMRMNLCLRQGAESVDTRRLRVGRRGKGSVGATRRINLQSRASPCPDHAPARISSICSRTCLRRHRRPGRAPLSPAAPSTR